MKIINFLVSILLLALFTCTHSPKEAGFNQSKMDSLFTLIENNQKGMGSLSIFKNGEEVYQRSIGYADVIRDVRASAKTKYRIGSISKSFTAAVIMQMVDEKKLTLNTKLAEYFPEIPNAGNITIEELLRHRSGLFNFTSAPDYKDWMEKPVTEEELIKKFIDNGTVFSPDEKMEYSNTNYVLLSFIAEKIDHQKFSEILEGRITRPLKLKNTYYGGKINTENNEALSYTPGDGWQPATETDMSVPAGAGAVVSNPTDLNIFYNALFAGKVVSDSSLQLMKKMVDNYGLGMFRMPFHNKWAYGHNGGIDGFQSNVAYFPDDNVSVAYTANGVSMAMNDILIGALSIYFGRDYSFPEFKPAISMKSEDLDKYLGVYSSPAFPLKITITKKDNFLTGQATGQSSFQMEAYDTDKFRFDPAGLTMEFKPAENKMILRQSGGEYTLTRE